MYMPPRPESTPQLMSHLIKKSVEQFGVQAYVPSDLFSTQKFVLFSKWSNCLWKVLRLDSLNQFFGSCSDGKCPVWSQNSD